MINSEIAKKIKQIELYTKKMARGLLQGENRSAIKGVGFNFDQIRDYQEGDDVRSIDWKSTARMNKLLVKQFKEEKTRTIMLMVDISSSTQFGSFGQTKQEQMAQVAAVLSLVSSTSNDLVGLMLFSDAVECFVPPKKGKKHGNVLLEKLFSFDVKRKKTNISVALDHVARLKQKDMTIFLISDFIDDAFEKKLAHVANKHEVIAISCIDENERQLPAIGFLQLQDQESENILSVDLRKNNAFNTFLQNRVLQQSALFRKYSVDHLLLPSEGEFVRTMIHFFKRRILH